MFVGELSTMARETASNAKAATSEPVEPSARAEVVVWLLMPLIAADDLRPSWSMLQCGVPCRPLTDRSPRGQDYAPYLGISSALAGTALRESRAPLMFSSQCPPKGADVLRCDPGSVASSPERTLSQRCSRALGH